MKGRFGPLSQFQERTQSCSLLPDLEAIRINSSLKEHSTLHSLQGALMKKNQRFFLWSILCKAVDISTYYNYSFMHSQFISQLL
jgi:hypothetical protein